MSLCHLKVCWYGSLQTGQLLCKKRTEFLFRLASAGIVLHTHVFHYFISEYIVAATKRVLLFQSQSNRKVFIFKHRVPFRPIKSFKTTELLNVTFCSECNYKQVVFSGQTLSFDIQCKLMCFGIFVFSFLKSAFSR